MAATTTTLPQRLREAASTLEEMSALAGYTHLAYVGWSAETLRQQADAMDSGESSSFGRSLGGGAK